MPPNLQRYAPVKYLYRRTSTPRTADSHIIHNYFSAHLLSGTNPQIYISIINTKNVYKQKHKSFWINTARNKCDYDRYLHILPRVSSHYCFFLLPRSILCVLSSDCWSSAKREASRHNGPIFSLFFSGRARPHNAARRTYTSCGH